MMKKQHIAALLIAYMISPFAQVQAETTVERIAQAPIDEWFYGIGDKRNQWLPDAKINGEAQSPPAGAIAKRNGGYVWAMASVGDKLWFSSLNNGWCGWMMVTGQFFPSQNSKWACETFRSQYPKQAARHADAAWPEGAYKIQADWRPPAIYMHDVRTGEFQQVQSNHPTFKHMVARSFGFRAAGSADGVVFMASNPLVRDDASVFILAFDGETGAFIDGVQLANYVNVRRFRVLRHADGSKAMYVLVGAEMHASDFPNHLLRWVGSRERPFGNQSQSATPGFEVVGDLGNVGSGAELLDHKGRLLVTTWGSETVAAGLYQTNDIPSAGFSTRQPAIFNKVFDAHDFDPDPVIAMSWLIGAIEEFDGYIYWGTMFPNGQGFQQLVKRNPSILFNAKEAIIKAHRRTHLFRTDFSNPDNPVTELLYGEEKLWTYDEGEWLKKANRLSASPLFGESGFGEYFNDYTWTMINYQGSLYLGTFDVSGGIKAILEETDCELCCYVLRTLAEHAQLDEQTPGFDLYRFDAGDRPASVVTLDGFGNDSNNGIRNAIVMNQSLYIGSSSYSNVDGVNGGWELFKLTQEKMK